MSISTLWMATILCTYSGGVKIVDNLATASSKNTESKEMEPRWTYAQAVKSDVQRFCVLVAIMVGWFFFLIGIFHIMEKIALEWSSPMRYSGC